MSGEIALGGISAHAPRAAQRVRRTAVVVAVLLIATGFPADPSSADLVGPTTAGINQYQPVALCDAIQPANPVVTVLLPNVAPVSDASIGDWIFARLFVGTRASGSNAGFSYSTFTPNVWYTQPTPRAGTLTSGGNVVYITLGDYVAGSGVNWKVFGGDGVAQIGLQMNIPSTVEVVAWVQLFWTQNGAWKTAWLGDVWNNAGPFPSFGGGCNARHIVIPPSLL